MRLIIKCLNWIKYFFVQILYKSFYRRYETLIYFFFLKFQIKKYKKVVLVYDFSCSPDTYGDYFEFIFLLRYFELLKKKVFFVILNDKVKSQRVDKKYFLKYLNQLKQISSRYSLKKNTKTITIDYLSFKNKFLRKDQFVLYKSKVIKRSPIYNNCFNLLNIIFNSLNNKMLNKILLKNRKFIFKKKLPKNYIAIQARKLTIKDKIYKNLDTEKNINLKDLKYLLNRILKKKFFHVVIISTQKKNFFRRKLKISNKRIYFSTQFAKNYLETGYLVLNSKLFLAHNTTGIGLFAIFSKIPYIISFPYHTLQHEFIWSKFSKKLTSWQLEKQKTYFKMTFKEYAARVNNFLDTYEI